MSVRTARSFALSACLAGCTPAEAPADTPLAVDWVPFDTDEPCVRAEVACAVGNCAARLANRCDTARTCELTMQCLCQALTGESGEARNRAGATIPARSRAGIRTHAICSAGEVLATHAESVRCH